LKDFLKAKIISEWLIQNKKQGVIAGLVEVYV
jgi:hypothetical protein